MEIKTGYILKTDVLRASQDRVWQAISDEQQFGTWFGAEFDGPFIAGAQLKGRITPTKVDPQVAREKHQYTGTQFQFNIDLIHSSRHFSFSWYPFGMDSTLNFLRAIETSVIFELEDVNGRTRFMITESGLEQIPVEYRSIALAGRESYWKLQIYLIEKFLSGARDLRPK